MKKIICISIAVLFTVACAKIKNENLPAATEALGQFHQLLVDDSVNLYNYVLINSHQTASTRDSSFRISAVAGFMDSLTFKNAKATSVVINNRTIAPSLDSTFNFNYSADSVTLPEGKALSGTTVQVKITGNTPADTVTKFIYMPKNLIQTVNGFPQARISTLDDLTLTWLPDASNPYSNVYIKLVYNGHYSRSHNPVLPEAINPLEFTVSDNGSYTIPKASLQNFPDDGYIDITIGRASQNESVLPVSQKRVFYFGISSTSTPLIHLAKSGSIMATNSVNKDYVVKFTSSVTAKEYIFTLQDNSSYHLLGKVPMGKYFVTITPTPSGVPGVTFGLNGTIKTGTSAFFNNVTITEINGLAISL